MKHIKSYTEFLNEQISAELTVSVDDMLSVLKDQIDIFKLFSIGKDQIVENSTIDDLYNNNNFNEILTKKSLKKGKIEDTSFDETLLGKNTSIKFFFIYGKESIQIEEPKFIIVQYIKDNKRSNIIGYDNVDSANNFYKKLTDATIELTDGKKSYIYKTSNGGNDWELGNVQMEKGDIKGELGKDELSAMIKKLNLKIKD